ncbi:hypothetical protein COCMIDRAFT_31166 [Bipolaris oryzae ATCC 44560]|uniref:Fe2OG dioxygenase domain-containing protein n=1 Tax=Bipolaris oryzae ATCC 44560 TaxID=930090 RepID=W6YKP6_COCMI|nr:uncharacterized protein COCMIDRAFT_31166 [Bipolaris oryzae ATCC 44560]EUC39762.1 hypothetical protein COCMIDRAFT_31166 [Bipolaris oryzae ATCC 44560]
MAPHADIDVDHVAQGPGPHCENAEHVTISIDKIMDCNRATEEILLNASKDLGFFYLDVRNHPAREVTKQIEMATLTALQFYQPPQKERSTWELNKDHISGEEVLGGLSRSLNLGDKQNLAKHHRKCHAFPSALGLLKYLHHEPESEEVRHASHTDFEILFMVFSDVGGFQVYHPGKKKWMFIPPKLGHIVCDIDDLSEFLSKSLLRTSLHRIIPQPTEKSKRKLAVVYLTRPDIDAVFVDREGKEWRSVDWQDMKNRLAAEDLEFQTSNLALTGRLSHDDLWKEKEV